VNSTKLIEVRQFCGNTPSNYRRLWDEPRPQGTPIVIVYLLNEINASLKVHAKINERPFDSFSLVLLLFKHKHVMVEELLKFLVREVDAKLLEAVELFQGRAIRDA
jgi:hypothetical protein